MFYKLYLYSKALLPSHQLGQLQKNGHFIYDRILLGPQRYIKTNKHRLVVFECKYKMSHNTIGRMIP